MVGKVFGKRGRSPEGAAREELDPGTQAVLAEIERQRPQNPMIGLQIGSQEIVHSLIKGLTGTRGVHAESLLAILGSLAGYACVASLGERAVRERKTPQQLGVMVATTKDGRNWWFGNGVNGPLAESRLSVWSLVGGAAQHLGAKTLLDPGEVLSHVAKTLGNAEFGIPRLPDEHRPGDHPINYVRQVWPSLAKTRDLFCREPAEWPVLFGLAAQRAMEMTKNTLEPSLAAQIVFECAAPMSKLDPLAEAPEALPLRSATA